MEERGIGIVYGRWLIEGAPRVLLIDTKTAYRFLDEWKADLWNTAGIPSPPGDDETNEAVVFGYLVAWFLGEVIARKLVESRQWLTKIVCLPRKGTRRYCSLPRMALRCSITSMQEATNRCYHHFHYPRNSSREISLRWFGRFLQ